MRSPRLPRPGETLSGHGFEIIPGGKGANQAVASARLGSTVYMVGRVGTDDFGQRLLSTLQREKINTDGILMNSDTHSGIAMVTVADNGENQILLAAGVNGNVDETDVKRLIPFLKESSVLLLQLEIPIQAVIAAAQAARKLGVFVILDPAPAPESIPVELYQYIDVLTPNQTEAERLVKFPIKSMLDAEHAAFALQQQGARHVILTMAGQGSISLIDDKIFQIPAFPVEVADTTAAGDAFNGALAAAIEQTQNWSESLRWANAAGAIAATRFGAQPSLPTYETLNRFLRDMND